MAVPEDGRLVCFFVRLRISPARIKLAASNFACLFRGVLGRESPTLGNCAPQKPKIGRIGAQQVDVRSACVDNRTTCSLTVIIIIIFSYYYIKFDRVAAVGLAYFFLTKYIDYALFNATETVLHYYKSALHASDFTTA